MSTLDVLARLSARLDERTPALTRLDGYYAGTQPASFLAPEARVALGDRLRVLSVNLPRLQVQALAERLGVTGFRTAGPDTDPDADLWRIWRANGLEDASAQAHVDALVYGRAFVIVWAGRTPQTPRVTVESARQVAVEYDPGSREVTCAVKRWSAGGRGQAVVYERDRITRYTSSSYLPVGTVSPAPAEGTVPELLSPAGGWSSAGSVPNPLGVVPVVPLVNRGRLLDVDGVSEMADVLGLTDALNKVMSDAMVTSEFFARPRRWAVGLELVEDDQGNAVNPFPNEADRMWQSEDPATRFGQFDAARLDGYSDLAATITHQIGALTGLPPHYLGLHGDQPASADAIRSAEASLVARAVSRQRTFGQAWSDVAALILAVRDGQDPAALDVETVWASPETRTPAQAA
ncbi:MAG TPA: phage portal protein, partial [Mycobacteriales bacterium]|nr:phage portal protein [Mycobacteriales bacterium]